MPTANWPSATFATQKRWDAAAKIARKRLTVLELAETLGNISEACKRGGMDRTSFYEWKRRFQTHGLEGLNVIVK